MSLHITHYRFCPECATPLVKSPIDGMERLHCPDCGFVYWGEFSIGTGGIIWRGDRVLLVQRGRNPGKGRWTIPGGFVEQRERLEDAVVREIREETGVLAEPVKLIAVRDRPGEKHDEYFIFLMRYLGGEPRVLSDEIAATGFFTLDECRQLEISDLTWHMIKISRTLTQAWHKIEGVKLTGECSTLYHGE